MPAQRPVDEDDVLGELDVHRPRPVAHAQLHQLLVELVVLSEGVGQIVSQDLGEELDVGIHELVRERLPVLCAYADRLKHLGDLAESIVDRRQEEIRVRSQMFIDALDVDDVIAHLLLAEGFVSLEQVAFVPLPELAEIEGFDEDVAEELRMRARTFLEEQDRKFDEERRALGVTDEVAALEGVNAAMSATLGKNEIRTLDDLGDLASDELIEMLGDQAPEVEGANAIIMAARAHWFDDEPVVEGEPADDGEGPATTEPAEGDPAEAKQD